LQDAEVYPVGLDGALQALKDSAMAAARSQR
jgi:hypothetical protein